MAYDTVYATLGGTSGHSLGGALERGRVPPVPVIVVTTGIEPSSNIGNALVSAMYGRSSELGLYLWGNPPLPPVQGLPPPVGGG